MTSTQMRTFRMSDEEWATLKETASQSGLTVSEWVRVAIRKQLEETKATNVVRQP